jgi:mono/diheme cytochrome c family protein
LPLGCLTQSQVRSTSWHRHIVDQSEPHVGHFILFGWHGNARVITVMAPLWSNGLARPTIIGMQIKVLVGLAAVAVAVLSVVAWVATEPSAAFAQGQAQFLEQPGDAKHGQIIFNAADCASCHTSPGQPDRLRLGGGLALTSPMGTFRVPNISPDPVDGIGTWTTTDLANALISGVSPDRRHYFPALPYVWYSHMQPEDVRDLMAYLRTLPVVQGRPPPHELPFPFNIRRVVGFWKMLFFDPGPLVPDETRDAVWNRGRYLVEALGHCAECHTEHNLLGAVERSNLYAGGPDVGGVGFVPNITAERISHWSQQELAEMLRTGVTPDLRSVGSTMADVIRNTAALPQADRDAIAAYIKSLPPQPTPHRSKNLPS